MRVFVSTPVRGNVQENLRLAQRITLWLLKYGYSPVCPHCITLTVGLDDSNEYDREIGMDYALELLSVCDRMIVVRKPDGSISEGCQMELDAALDIPYYIVTWEEAEQRFTI